MHFFLMHHTIGFPSPAGELHLSGLPLEGKLAPSGD